MFANARGWRSFRLRTFLGGLPFAAGGAPFALKNLPGWPTLCGFCKGWVPLRFVVLLPPLLPPRVHLQQPFPSIIKTPTAPRPIARMLHQFRSHRGNPGQTGRFLTPLRKTPPGPSICPHRTGPDPVLLLTWGNTGNTGEHGTRGQEHGDRRDVF